MSEEIHITGNKGEWSELYVLLRILGDGRVYYADGNLKKIPKKFLEISRVVRHDDGAELTFIRNPDSGVVEIFRNREQLNSIGIQEFVDQYRLLIDAICNNNGAFSVPKTEDFLHRLGCSSLKAPSTDKTDITMVVHEPKTGLDLEQGFSIKSMLGHPSTLVNPSKSTNFIYTLDGGIDDSIAKNANKIFYSESSTKIIDTLSYLKANGIILRFTDTQDRTLYNNLTLIDSSLPQIAGEMLKLHYQEGVSRISEQIEILNKTNPIGYRNVRDIPYYEYKIRKMLSSYALGMQSSKPWKGVEDANGGYLIVKNDGEVLCYHSFDRGSFEEYLIRSTKFDTPSTKRYDYAYVYEEGGEFKLKLNMQIRFIARRPKRNGFLAHQSRIHAQIGQSTPFSQKAAFFRSVRS